MAKVFSLPKCDLVFQGGYNSQNQFPVDAADLESYLQQKLPGSQKRQVTLSNGHVMNVLENQQYAVIYNLYMQNQRLRGGIEVCRL